MYENGIISRFTGWMRGIRAGGGIPDIYLPDGGAANPSADMQNAIRLWRDMYTGGYTQSLNLPSAIAAEIARIVTIEMDFSLTGSPAADFTAAQYTPLFSNLRRYVEYACAEGGIVLKPSLDSEAPEIEIECVHADRFLPLKWDSGGNITEAAFLYEVCDNRFCYVRTETHRSAGGGVIVANTVTRSASGGKPEKCALTEVPVWAALPDERFYPIPSPLFAYFRIPLGNTIDRDSPLGVSVYSRATGLIEEADKQFRRLLWEFEGGELAVDVSEDLFRKTTHGLELPAGKERLFRANLLDSAIAGNGELMRTFAPALRDQSFINGLDMLLIRIEDVCGLARGTLSTLNNIDKTATEIRNSKQRSYCTVRDIQLSLKQALCALTVSVKELAVQRGLVPDGECKPIISFGDSIIEDTATERQRDLLEVQNGLLKPYEFRMKWYGEDADAAKAALST